MKDEGLGNTKLFLGFILVCVWFKRQWEGKDFNLISWTLFLICRFISSSVTPMLQYEIK